MREHRICRNLCWQEIMNAESPAAHRVLRTIPPSDNSSQNAVESNSGQVHDRWRREEPLTKFDVADCSKGRTGRKQWLLGSFESQQGVEPALRSVLAQDADDAACIFTSLAGTMMGAISELAGWQPNFSRPFAIKSL